MRDTYRSSVDDHYRVPPTRTSSYDPYLERTSSLKQRKPPHKRETSDLLKNMFHKLKQTHDQKYMLDTEFAQQRSFSTSASEHPTQLEDSSPEREVGSLVVRVRRLEREMAALTAENHTLSDTVNAQRQKLQSLEGENELLKRDKEMLKEIKGLQERKTEDLSKESQLRHEDDLRKQRVVQRQAHDEQVANTELRHLNEKLEAELTLKQSQHQSQLTGLKAELQTVKNENDTLRSELKSFQRAFEKHFEKRS